MQKFGPGDEEDQELDHGCVQVLHEKQHYVRAREGSGDAHYLILNMFVSKY